MSENNAPAILPVGYTTKSFDFDRDKFYRALPVLKNQMGFEAIAVRSGIPEWMDEQVGSVAKSNSDILFLTEYNDDILMMGDCIPDAKMKIENAKSAAENYKGDLPVNKIPVRFFGGHFYIPKVGPIYKTENGRHVPEARFLETWKNVMGPLNEFCEKNGTMLVLENTDKNSLDSIRVMSELMSGREYPNIRLLADPANCTERGKEMNTENWYMIGALHAKNKRGDVQLPIIHDGAGDLDIKDFVKIIREYGSQFGVPYLTILEPDQSGVRYSSDLQVEYLAKDFKYLQKAFNNGAILPV